MPRAPKTCGIGGCPAIVPHGERCPKHRHTWGKGADRYRTNAHRAWSKAVRDRDKTCQLRYDGCTGGADTADHIVPISAGGDPLDLRNGQAACWHCHRRKSSREGNLAQGRQPRQ